MCAPGIEGMCQPENGFREWGLTEAGVPGTAEHMALCNATQDTSHATRVVETHHAGVHRSLLNVPCDARDKCIPILKVRVKVSL